MIVNDLTDQPDAAFDSMLETVEARDEAVESHGTVEKVAAALNAAPTEQTWLSHHDLRVLALAAIAALDSRQGDGAVRRVLALADEWEATAVQSEADAAEFDRAGFQMTGAVHRDDAVELRAYATRIRAAVAGQP